MPRNALAGRTALITGGTSGIGLALTRELVAAGVTRIVVIGRDADRLTAAAMAHPGIVVPYRADLAGSAAVLRLLRDVPTLAPSLSIVINNAGVQQRCDFTHDDLNAIAPRLQDEITTNLTSVVMIAGGLLPLLARQPASVVVNVTSGLALAPKRSAPVYCATKAAVRSFTRALRDQCRAAQLPVSVIEALPPLVDTPMTAGRGRGKITAEQCARAIVNGIERGTPEVYVGKAMLLRVLMRLSPSLGYRLMRDG